MTVGERLAYYREKKGISLGELSRLTNIPKTNLQRYEKGTTKKIPIDVIPVLEKALTLQTGTLMGWIDENEKEQSEDKICPLTQENVYPRPLYNSVAAGFGVIADNTIVSYIPTYISNPLEQEQYIWINVQGDSMSPLIDDGSKILIKKQDSVDSGQIAVVLIDDEDAVVKKVNYGKDWIELISVNPYYPPRRFEDKDVRRVRVLGLVKEVSKELQ